MFFVPNRRLTDSELESLNAEAERILNELAKTLSRRIMFRHLPPWQAIALYAAHYKDYVGGVWEESVGLTTDFEGTAVSPDGILGWVVHLDQYGEIADKVAEGHQLPNKPEWMMGAVWLNGNLPNGRWHRFASELSDALRPVLLNERDLTISELQRIDGLVDIYKARNPETNWTEYEIRALSAPRYQAMTTFANDYGLSDWFTLAETALEDGWKLTTTGKAERIDPK